MFYLISCAQELSSFFSLLAQNVCVIMFCLIFSQESFCLIFDLTSSHVLDFVKTNSCVVLFYIELKCAEINHFVVIPK